jgi:hypothetical protein
MEAIQPASGDGPAVRAKGRFIMARAQIQGRVSNPVRKSTTERGSKRLVLWILIFAVLTPVFVIGPALVGQTFPPYPLMSVADVFDLFTPLVLIPIYWLLFQWVGKDSPSLGNPGLHAGNLWVEASHTWRLTHWSPAA